MNASKTDDDYSKLSGKELLALYSSIDQSRFPEKAREVETALREKMNVVSAPVQEQDPEQRWLKNRYLFPALAALIYALIILSKYIYTPSVSEMPAFMIINLSLNILLISILIFWASSRSILAGILLFLYFLQLMFGIISIGA